MCYYVSGAKLIKIIDTTSIVAIYNNYNTLFYYKRKNVMVVIIAS